MPKIPKGSTLTSLAKQYNTTVDELMKANAGNPSVKSRDLILAGGELNLPGAGRSLEGTMQQETPDMVTPSGGSGVPEQRDIPTMTNGTTNFKEGLNLIDNYYRGQQESPQQIIQKLGSQLGDIINPNVMTGALGQYDALRKESSAGVFKSAMDVITELQTNQQNYMQTVLGKLDFVPTVKEYQELLSGNPSEEFMAKINESEERKRQSDRKTPTIQKIRNPLTGVEEPFIWDEATNSFKPAPIGAQTNAPGATGDLGEVTQEFTDFNNWMQGVGKVTQGFDTPVSYFNDGRKTHGGFDIAGAIDSPVTSPVSGKIVEAQSTSGWGTSVVIQDAEGNKWRLAHFNKINVQVGQRVQAGEQIGLLGNTGFVLKGDGTAPTEEELAQGRGAHLHVEVRGQDGKLINPAQGMSETDMSGIPNTWEATLKNKTPQQVEKFMSLSEIDKSNTMQLINGDALLSDLMSSRGVEGSLARQRMLKIAQDIDPDFSENTNKIRYEFNKKWSSTESSVGRFRTALNTAIGHLADFKHSSDSLDPGALKKLNSVRNILDKETGDPNVLRLRTDIAALASEVAAAYKGGNASASQEEIRTWEEVLASDFSKEQFQGVSDEIAKLLTSKITAIRYMYSSTMGKEYDQPLIDPDKRQMLIDAGVDPSVLAVENTTNQPKSKEYTPLTGGETSSGLKYTIEQ